jgi:signal transduction histidine kinase
MSFKARQLNVQISSCFKGFENDEHGNPLPLAMLDYQRFMQMVMNYCSNAVKFSDGGNILILVQKIKGH